MGTGKYNKRFGGFEPDEPKMKTVEITFTGSYEMEVPIDWDTIDILEVVDKYEVEDWDIDID